MALRFVSQLDDTNFQNGLRRMEMNAKKSATGINRAFNSTETFGSGRGFAGGIGRLFGGAGIAVLALDIAEAVREAQKLNAEIAKATGPTAGSQNNSMSQLASQLKTVNDLLETRGDSHIGADNYFKDMQVILGNPKKGPSGLASEAEEQGDALIKQRALLNSQIAEKAEKETQMMEMRLQGRNMEADLLKNELDYAEKIQEAIRTQNTELQQQLHIRQELERRVIQAREGDKQSAYDQAIQNSADQTAFAKMNPLEQAKYLREKARNANTAAQRALTPDEQRAHGLEAAQSAQQYQALLNSISRSAAQSTTNFGLSGPDARRQWVRDERDREREARRLTRIENKGLKDSRYGSSKFRDEQLHIGKDDVEALAKAYAAALDKVIVK